MPIIPHSAPQGKPIFDIHSERMLIYGSQAKKARTGGLFSQQVFGGRSGLPRGDPERYERRKLLDLDGSAGSNQLLLDLLGLVLGDSLLDSLGAALDHVLGFLQTQTGDLADDLDDVDLVGAEV